MSVKNLKKELEKVVTENTIKVLYLCSEAAKKLSLRIFLIGGAVRDIITGKNNFDTDITVQGNAIEFARFLEQNYPDICKIKEIHENFGTTKVIFYINEKIATSHLQDAPHNDENLIILDIASTRKESYPYPGSLPKVDEIGCDLYDDVNRRDFSINSMAISLNKENFGDLTDYLGGYDDIKRKKIMILHEKSFIDDPTRIIRALKFRVRFGYDLDDTTRKLQNKLLESGMFDDFCGKRITSELKQTFNLNKSEIMEIFLRENIYRLVDKDIKTFYRHCEQNNNNWIASSQAPRNDITCESLILEYLNFINPDFIWLIYLGVMFLDFSKEKIAQIAEKLYLSNQETEILIGAKTLLEKAESQIPKQVRNDVSCHAELVSVSYTNFEIYEFFEGFMPESILILLIKKPELKEKVELYFKELKDIKIHTTGETLINLGLKPSPVFKEILRELLKARINGEFFSEEEENEFLKKILR